MGYHKVLPIDLECINFIVKQRGSLAISRFRFRLPVNSFGWLKQASCKNMKINTEYANTGVQVSEKSTVLRCKFF